MVRAPLRLMSLVSAGLATTGLGVYGAQYWDPNDFGVVRIGRAALTVSDCLDRRVIKQFLVDQHYECHIPVFPQIHSRSARHLLDLCCTNRGTFIKVGQHLGAMEYLLPPEYTRTLSVLHSQAPPTPLPDVLRVIREELGKEANEVFERFEETPLGAASLAQVHRAVLKDGQTVAVKVQHPKVQKQSSRDILLMEVLLHIVKKIFPQFEFMWLIEEAKKNIPLELDFLNEGRNAEKLADMVSRFPFLKIPRIHWELSTKRLLVMEYVEGGQVNDREYMERHKIDVNQVSRALGKLYSEMIFVHGFVHCDPHPGNVLVRQSAEIGGPEIILLDHGLYQKLTDTFRLDYCRLWQALIAADMEGIRIYSQRMGAGNLYPLLACMLAFRSWKVVNRGIDRRPATKEEAQEIRRNATAFLPLISQLLASVPRQMLLLLKTNDLLRGIETALHTRTSFNSFLSMSRCCVRALSRHRKSSASSLWSYTHICISESVDLAQLQLYEIFLYAQSTCVGRWLSRLIRWISHTVY
ncbi:unnamed protein product [Staurois parvus]|uniref:AarF domain-containing protein kinase 1 n=1 Tax=Staurois parvus TaxID=386267 RepID=A0ABN9D450_9NEOB|nr:unnamed protein product [Staurois parvus]